MCLDSFFIFAMASAWTTPEGREFASFEHAVAQATHDARDLAAHDLREGHLNRNYGVEIATGKGEILLTVRFREVFTVEDPRP